MHADVTNFISEIELTQTHFVNNHCVNRKVGNLIRDKFTSELEIILLEAFVEALEYYIRDTTSVVSGDIVLSTSYNVRNDTITYDGTTYIPGESFTGTATTIFAGGGTVTVDDNLFTQAEAQDIVDHINKVMDSTHYLKLTDYF